ncbi:hypothetical protein TNCV_60621 [Trichonephila clavipes]|nr:hypothetical protein TNCV_60621 [Trichonephila clavipes]
MSPLDVDPTDDENQSPCFQRRMLRRRIATEKMLLKTYQELNSKFNTSNPSLMETPNTAAAEMGCLVEVNAPDNSSKKVNSDNNESKTSVKVNTKNKKKFKKRKLKKDSVEDFVFPKKTARPASPSISEPVAIANSFSDLDGDKNQVIEDEEAKIADIPNPRPLQPIHLKIKETFRKSMLTPIIHFIGWLGSPSLPSPTPLVLASKTPPTTIRQVATPGQ